MTALHLAKENEGSSVVSIQNPYNLLSRVFDEGLSEIAHRERVPLIAYSPLAFGKLTGKYLHGKRPQGARLTQFPRFDRFNKPAADQALQAYQKLARELGLSLLQLSLGFVLSRPFVASTLLGATTADQLAENLDAARHSLPDHALERIEKIHARYPNPCP
jgi:aryl-alcohol dehydrogenase-like predicted oxidoreductase